MSAIKGALHERGVWHVVFDDGDVQRVYDRDASSSRRARSLAAELEARAAALRHVADTIDTAKQLAVGRLCDALELNEAERELVLAPLPGGYAEREQRTDAFIEHLNREMPLIAAEITEKLVGDGTLPPDASVVFGTAPIGSVVELHGQPVEVIASNDGAVAVSPMLNAPVGTVTAVICRECSHAGRLHGEDGCTKTIDPFEVCGCTALVSTSVARAGHAPRMTR